MSWAHNDHGQPDEITAANYEEARRERLRQKIANIFGDDTPGFTRTIRGDQRSFDEIANNPYGPGNAIYETAPALSGAPARQQFATEESDLTGSLRGNYSDELKRRYNEAERQERFGAARTGNIGSTSFADEMSKISEENQRGGLNIEDAVRRAVSNLRTSREDVRARALNLVNAGQGEEGVRSATSGLRSAAENARAANRERLFDELFTNLAYANASANRSSQADQLARLLAGRGGTSYATPISGGRLVP